MPGVWGKVKKGKMGPSLKPIIGNGEKKTTLQRKVQPLCNVGSPAFRRAPTLRFPCPSVLTDPSRPVARASRSSVTARPPGSAALCS